MRQRRWAGILALALVATACSGGDDDTSGDGDGDERGPEVAAVTTDAVFDANGSINAAYVLDAAPGTELLLVDADDREVARKAADDLGSAVFYEVEPGDGYTVRSIDGDTVAGTDEFAVLEPGATPDPSLYDQELAEGLNYVVMRDGVEIAMTVRLPSGKTMDDAPFPTVIEYSGYQVAAPHDLLDDVVARLADPNLPPDPLVPSTSTAVGSLAAPVLGYATVSVQMRGTGCSGGAFDLFDYPTTYDGYDAVETVAAQDWVEDNKVGMVGISFSAISQLFVAGTQPPHLAAISPLSSTDDLYRTVGSPGGIFNNGFAKSWLDERVEDAKPAPEGGQPWAKELVKQGDEHCIANQELHGQALDPFAVLRENPARVPELYDHREPGRWAADIDVPVFMSNAFQDEQIIGAGPGTIAGLGDNPDVYVTLVNGTHVDPLGPGAITRWAEFLGLFVADDVPVIPDTVLSLGGVLYEEVAHAASAPIAQTRFAGRDLTLEDALEEYRADPRVLVLMDNGGGPTGLGALEPVWQLDLDDGPSADVEPTPWYLGPEGALDTAEPDGASEETYVSDAGARPEVSLPEGDPWDAQPPYKWEPVADGNGLGFVSEPLAEDLVVAGPASLDLYLSSTATDTDVQVTISEVRPDGDESYAQFGVLRASHRALDEDRSTDLEAVHTFAPDTVEELEPGAPTLVRVPIYPFAWAFRAGSRIRVTIQAPGGERPAWKFATTEEGSATNTVHLGGDTPSALVLPVLPGRKADAPLPPCGALRGSPCRAYEPAANGG